MHRIALALATFFFATVAHAAETCEVKRLLSLEARPDPSGHLYVPATLNDRPTHLVIDTGGVWSTINEPMVAALGLKVRRMPIDAPVHFLDATGARIARYARVPSVKLGTWHLPRPADFLLIADVARGLELDGGSVGLNILASFDVEIDNAKKTVSLFAQRNCPDAGVHWAAETVRFDFHWQGGTPVAEVEIDGETVSAVIDTGTTRTLLDSDFARRHFGLTPNSPGMSRSGRALMPGGSETEIFEYRFETLSVSGIKFENVPVTLMNLEGRAGLVLGMNELKRLHLYFAFRERAIYATAADAH